MKKNISFFCTVLTIFCLTFVGCTNQSNTVENQEETSPQKKVVFASNFVNAFEKQVNLELFYNVDSRFQTTITKENLHKAKSISDILPRKATRQIESYQLVQVNILDGESEKGKNGVLTTAQLELLQSADYSTDIYISANYKTKNTDTGKLEHGYLTYFISVVPEKEAEFTSGHDALIEYLKENSKAKTAIIQKKNLRAGKVSFTITKKGTISNVKLISASGYHTVDERLMELISNMPEKWIPASNSKGEKVEQEFVFFFGMEGC